MKIKLLQTAFFIAFCFIAISLLSECNKDNTNPSNSSDTTKIKTTALWTKLQSIDAGSWAYKVEFTDSLNIWALAIATQNSKPVTNLPVTILNSNDCGKTWKTGVIPNSYKYGAVMSSVNGNLAFVNTYKGIYMTTDRGSTWSLINTDSAFLKQDGFFHFFNQNEGVRIIGNDNQNKVQNDSIWVYKTTDGGISWANIYTTSATDKLEGELPSFDCISAIGDTVAFVTSCARIFISYDKGNTWKIKQCGSNPYEYVYSFSMKSSKKFALLSWGQTNISNDTSVLTMYTFPKIFSTETGGDTWLSPYNAQSNIFSISSIPGNNGIYIGTSYYYGNVEGSSIISVNDCRSFVSVDSLATNICTSAFYSIHTGFGTTFNANDPNMTDKTNNICKWDPEVLYRKGIILK